MTLFKFRITWVDADGKIYDYDAIQERYVVAETEDEAIAKIENYRKEMVNKGFSDFKVHMYPEVECENIIV